MQAQRYFPTADKRMNIDLLFGFGGIGLSIQWFGDMTSANQELQNSGMLSIPGYTVSLSPDE